MPVFAASQKAGNKRSDLAWSRKARSCSEGADGSTWAAALWRLGVCHDVAND
jgi:hypothetical protein